MHSKPDLVMKISLDNLPVTEEKRKSPTNSGNLFGRSGDASRRTHKLNQNIATQNEFIRSAAFSRQDSSKEGGVMKFPRTENQDSSAAKFLQSVIDASASNVAILDETRTILYVNRAWREFAAQSGLLDREYGVGSKYPDLCRGIAAASPEDSNAIAEGLRQIIENNEIEFQTEFQCRAVAEPLWFQMHAAAFRLPAPNQRLAIMVSHDNISSAKIAAEELRKDEDRLRRLLETTNILPWEADAKSWSFTYVGEQAVQMFGFGLEKWLEPDFWISHIYPEDRERVIAECSKLLQTVDHYQLEYRMIAKDNKIVWIHDLVSVVRENSKPVTIRGFMIDVTERKQSEDTLRHLSGRLITAQEEERKRIARELHDDLNQRIALISIELEQIGQLMTNEGGGLTERMKGLQKKAEEISTEIHRMSYQLHPSKLDHLGLTSALNSFCKELSASRGLKINVRDEGIPVTLPKDIKLCIFRIAQEALQNAAKHSGASKVEVILKKSDRVVELIISDVGCGFDTAGEKMTRGLGFLSMQERLRLVDGEIRIYSRASEGTRIEVKVPI
jgi:PAS domain S-box-containing protein